VIRLAVLLIVISQTPALATGAGSEGAHPPTTSMPAIPETSTAVSGLATWYCGGGSACTRGYPATYPGAAAGSELRVGAWRGRWVRVCAGSRCTRARLIDACACPGERVIDLYASVFRRLAPLSRGVVRVSVAFLAGSDVVLPPTDTEGLR
jgi:hypothetical protein